MAHITTAPRGVLLACIHEPMQVAGHYLYMIEIEPGERFVSVRLPTIFDVAGQVIQLTSEISPGSRVRVHADGHALRAVQIIERHVPNPFA